MRPVMVLSAALALAATPLLAAPAAAGGQPFTVTLTGAAEVPGPGDADGSGTATLTFNQGLGEVCWSVTTDDIAPITGVHIHAGAAGVAGPVVVALSAGSGCTTVDSALAKQIRKDASSYYVNVHTTEYPAGALRGQLG